MCWASKNKPVKLVAIKDIPIFKVGFCIGDMVMPYFFQKNIIYKENTLYEVNDVKPFYTTEKAKHEIHYGLHSYAISNIRLTGIDIKIGNRMIPFVGITTYKTTPLSQDVIIDGQKYKIEDIAILLCTIPQGATYYVNDIGEMVSDKLEVKHIIKTPFTTNKNNTISLRSVEKVNKSLDNWEKWNT